MLFSLSNSTIEQLTSVFIFVTILSFSYSFQKYILRLIFRNIANYFDRKNKHSIKEGIKAFDKPIRHLLLVFGILLGLSFYMKIIIFNNVYFIKILKTFIIFYASVGFFNLSSFYGDNPDEFKKYFKLKIENIMFPFFSRVMKFVIIAIGVALIFVEWGYDINGFIAGLGIGGLALALGAKDVLSNIFGGIAISIDKPFSIGDWISTDNGIEGNIEDINFRSTRIRTFDKAIIYVPNSLLANQSIYNWTRRDMRRVKFSIGVSPQTNHEKLIKVIDDIKAYMTLHDTINDENIFVTLENISQTSLDILICYFTNSPKYEIFLKTKQDVNFEIIKILNEEDVKIALPSQTIYINKS